MIPGIPRLFPVWQRRDDATLTASVPGTLDEIAAARRFALANARANDGPGPALMGANTLLGNDVYNKDGEDLGDIKEFMIEMESGMLPGL